MYQENLKLSCSAMRSAPIFIFFYIVDLEFSVSMTSINRFLKTNQYFTAVIKVSKLHPKVETALPDYLYSNEGVLWQLSSEKMKYRILIPPYLVHVERTLP